jgi:hypothetical protein
MVGSGKHERGKSGRLVTVQNTACTSRIGDALQYNTGSFSIRICTVMRIRYCSVHDVYAADYTDFQVTSACAVGLIS